MLHSSDEYDCLEECLDTEGCRSITFNGENCSLHNCIETVSSVDSIFYKRECVKSEYSLKAIIMHKCIYVWGGERMMPLQNIMHEMDRLKKSRKPKIKV